VDEEINEATMPVALFRHQGFLFKTREVVKFIQNSFLRMN